MDLQTIIDIDRQLLGVINGSHNMFLDTLMLTLTSGVYRSPASGELFGEHSRDYTGKD